VAEEARLRIVDSSFCGSTSLQVMTVTGTSPLLRAVSRIMAMLAASAPEAKSGSLPFTTQIMPWMRRFHGTKGRGPAAAPAGATAAAAGTRMR
jgi:hypothetical protein